MPQGGYRRLDVGQTGLLGFVADAGRERRLLLPARGRETHPNRTVRDALIGGAARVPRGLPAPGHGAARGSTVISQRRAHAGAAQFVAVEARARPPDARPAR